MRIPFGEWLPDQPALDNPGATIAENVIPYANGYGPIGDVASYTSAIAGNPTVTGLFQATNVSGSPVVFAGTTTTIQLLSSTQTWSDVSKSGGYSAANPWDFAQIGSRVIATAAGNAPQYYDIGTSTVFADLPGSPPTSKVVANIRNFIVLGDTATSPAGVQWSAYNNSGIWTPSRATQSDTRVLDQSGGRVQRIVPGQYGVIFQESSAWIMEYVGPPVIFNLREIEKGRGTVSGQSVCWHGDKIFYLASDGFYQFGDPPIPIGTEKVNRWFFDEAGEAQLSTVIGAVDPENQLVYWVFKAGATANYTRMIIYNWGTGRWSHVNATDFASNIHFLGTTRFSGNLETTSGRKKLVVVNALEQLCTLTGSALPATLETTEMGMDRRVAVNVRPLASGTTTIKVSQATRNDTNDTPTFGTEKAPNPRGTMNFRTPARYHRFRAILSLGFTDATGVDVEVLNAGER